MGSTVSLSMVDDVMEQLLCCYHAPRTQPASAPDIQVPSVVHKLTAGNPPGDKPCFGR